MTFAVICSLGATGAATSAGKFSVAGARQRLQQREQDDILSKLPRGPRLDREPREEGVGLGGGFKEYGGDRGGERLRCHTSALLDSTDSACTGGSQICKRCCKAYRPHLQSVPCDACAVPDGSGLSSRLLTAHGAGSRYGDDRREDRGERRSGWGDREDGSQASDDGPSRADMADDWGAARKFTPSGADDRGERRGFGSGGFADREPRRGFGNRCCSRACATGAIPSCDWFGLPGAACSSGTQGEGQCRMLSAANASVC